MSRKPSTEEAPPAEEEAAGAPAGVELEEALLSEGEVAPEVASPRRRRRRRKWKPRLRRQRRWWTAPRSS